MRSLINAVRPHLDLILRTFLICLLISKHLVIYIVNKFRSLSVPSPRVTPSKNYSRDSHVIQHVRKTAFLCLYKVLSTRKVTIRLVTGAGADCFHGLT